MLRRVKKELTMTTCSEENNARRYRRKTFLVLVVVLVVVVLAILELFGEEIKVEDDDMVLAHNHCQKSKVTNLALPLSVWQPYFILSYCTRNLCRVVDGVKD